MHPRPALTLALLALLSAPAGAATVQRSSGGQIDEQPVDAVAITAGPGEANALAIVVRRSGRDRQGSPTVVTVTDAGAPLTAGRGCAAAGPGTVRCRSTDELGTVSVRLGDGDDRLTLRAPTRDQWWFTTTVAAGPGNDRVTVGDAAAVTGDAGDDVLTGSSGSDTLAGGAGNDVVRGGADGDFLTGGPGDDRLFGDAGDDTLIGGDADAPAAPAGTDRLVGGPGRDDLDDGDTEGGVMDGDVLDGGPGEDEVTSYLGRTAPVTVDLGSGAPAGEPGEGDTIAGVERLFGGRGADLLVGGPGAEWIDGRDGVDEVRGGAGGDTLLADGTDRVLGEAGDDRLRIDASYAGDLRCGAGDDVVRLDVFVTLPAALPGPLLEPGCEQLWSGTGLRLRPVPAPAGRNRLAFTILRVPRAGLRLAVTSPTPPFATLGAGPLRGDGRLIVTMPGPAAAIRAAVIGLGGWGPFAWRVGG